MHVETVLVQRCSCVQLADILRYKTCIKIAAKTLSVPLSYPCVFNQTQPRRLGGKCGAHAYRGVNPDRQTNRRMEHSVIVAPSLCGREERRQFFFISVQKIRDRFYYSEITLYSLLPSIHLSTERQYHINAMR